MREARECLYRLIATAPGSAPVLIGVNQIDPTQPAARTQPDHSGLTESTEVGTDLIKGQREDGVTGFANEVKKAEWIFL